MRSSLSIPKEDVAANLTCSESQLDLVSMKGGVEPDLDSRIVVQGAHGEEIVRSLFVDTSNDTIFTAGEDGCIKAFGLAGTQEPGTTGAKTSKGKKGTDLRYKPY